MDYIEVDKDLIPYSFLIDLGADEYELEFGYNERHDFFTVDLYKDDMTLLVGEKLVLGRRLFSDLTDVSAPTVSITPTDRSGEETRITYDNFERTVFLQVGDVDEAV